MKTAYYIENVANSADHKFIFIEHLWTNNPSVVFGSMGTYVMFTNKFSLRYLYLFR